MPNSSAASASATAFSMPDDLLSRFKTLRTRLQPYLEKDRLSHVASTLLLVGAGYTFMCGDGDAFSQAGSLGFSTLSVLASLPPTVRESFASQLPSGIRQTLDSWVAPELLQALGDPQVLRAASLYFNAGDGIARMALTFEDQAGPRQSFAVMTRFLQQKLISTEYSSAEAERRESEKRKAADQSAPPSAAA